MFEITTAPPAPARQALRTEQEMHPCAAPHRSEVRQLRRDVCDHQEVDHVIHDDEDVGGAGGRVGVAAIL